MKKSTMFMIGMICSVMMASVSMASCGKKSGKLDAPVRIIDIEEYK